MTAPVLRVALPVPLPRLFDYLPPAGHGAGADDVGRRVRVPFGSRELVGVVVETGPSDAPQLELRQAAALLDPAPLLHGELWQSLRWLARYTHAPLGEVLATALPVALRQGEPLAATHDIAWQLTEAGHTALPGLRAGTRPRLLAEQLRHGPLREDALDRSLDGWRSAARALAKRGLAESLVLPAAVPEPAPQPGPPLND